MKNKKYNNGFTLIELSIVLVIIGLVVGGVLVGQDLIKAATVRAQVSQIENYKTAVNSFKLKYNFLPGDLPAAQAASLGFVTRSGATDHGDGNSQIITNCGGSGLGCESALFWTDLSSANMIDGSFSDPNADSSITATSSQLDSYIPKGKLIGARVEVGYVTANILFPINANTFRIDGTTSFAVGARTASDVITPLAAYNIDIKMDDGKPHAGVVFGDPGVAATSASSNDCVANDTGDELYNTSTSLYANTPSCFMRFKF